MNIRIEVMLRAPAYGNPSEMRSQAQLRVRGTRSLAIEVSGEDRVATLVIAAGCDSGLNAGSLLGLVKGIDGGGWYELAQGRMPGGLEAILGALRVILEEAVKTGGEP